MIEKATEICGTNSSSENNEEAHDLFEGEQFYSTATENRVPEQYVNTHGTE